MTQNTAGARSPAWNAMTVNDGKTGYMELLFPWEVPGAGLLRVDELGNITTSGNIDAPNVGGIAATGDSTGVQDTANINALVNLGARTVALAAGTFYIGGGAGLTLAAATALKGAGTGATILTMAAGLTGPAIQAPVGGYARVSDLSIVGASPTIASNPAQNAIEGGQGRYCRVDNVFFQYINGYMIEFVGTAPNTGYASMITNVSGLQSAGGIHLKGVSGAAFGGQYFISGLNLQQIGISATNLDALFIEDCDDILVANYNGAIAGSGQAYGPGNVNTGGTGSTFHIKGACSTVYSVNTDLGCFPNAAGITNSCYLIEGGTSNPLDIRFTQAIAQQSAVGATITAGSNIKFLQSRFTNNYTHGIVQSGSGSDIILEGCRLGQNGQGATGTNYDLSWPGSGTGYVRTTTFNSPIVLTGTAGVQNSVAIAAGQDVRFEQCPFTGTGASGFSTVFTNVPSSVRNCRGANPHGSVTVAVPSTNGSTTALGYDAMFYITASSGGSCTVQRNNGGPPVLIPASQLAAVFMPAGQTLKYTYTSGAPTQQVDGL